jgi:hypothetical protein
MEISYREVGGMNKGWKGKEDCKAGRDRGLGRKQLEEGLDEGGGAAWIRCLWVAERLATPLHGCGNKQICANVTCAKKIHLSPI